MIIPNMWENRKCSKPPTSDDSHSPINVNDHIYWINHRASPLDFWRRVRQVSPVSPACQRTMPPSVAAPRRRCTCAWAVSRGFQKWGYLVVHPTNRKWVSSPQTFLWTLPPLIPWNNQGELTHLRFVGWATKYPQSSIYRLGYPTYGDISIVIQWDLMVIWWDSNGEWMALNGIWNETSKYGD